MRRKKNALILKLIHSYADAEDVICSLATPSGVGALSIIRVSGAGAESKIRRIAKFLPAKLDSHRLYYGILREPESGVKIDQVLISYFMQGHSFTGEESFEISCHGSPWLVDQIIQSLIEVGCRLAMPGEFTARAFFEGRIDLLQAESVLDLIHSRSRLSAQLSLHQLEGSLSSLIKTIADEFNWVLANLEANIDFAAEDIEIASNGELLSRLSRARALVSEVALQFKFSQRVRDGLRIGLVGAPNAGKSSLLNALVGFDRAIVSEEAGTTRDFIEEKLVIDGFTVTVVDTAGLRETNNQVEAEGVLRSKAIASEVDVLFLVVDSRRLKTDQVKEWFIALKDIEKSVVYTKSDLLADRCWFDSQSSQVLGGQKSFLVSSKTGEGLALLRGFLSGFFGHQSAGQLSDGAVLINSRHYELLRVAGAESDEAISLLEANESPELVALCLQKAYSSCLQMTGEELNEQVADRIFKEFCLGK